MSYLTFLLCFVIAPAVLFIVALSRRYSRHCAPGFSLRQHWIGATILAVIALVWTTPWDNLIIARGVWSYGESRVLGTLGLVPIEEYAFMVAMPLLNASILGWMLLRRPIKASQWRQPQGRARALALLRYAALWIAALFLLRVETNTYLCAILLWFLPPLALQAVFDPHTLSRNWRFIAVATLIPTLYFSAVDAFAIGDGIWTIHATTRTGLEAFGLPIEEALFFFVTSHLLARGLVLWHSLLGSTRR